MSIVGLEVEIPLDQKYCLKVVVVTSLHVPFSTLTYDLPLSVIVCTVDGGTERHS